MINDIKIKNLTISLGGKKIFDNYNAVIDGGRLTLLMDKSGAGKTTLLRAIAGLCDFEGEISGTENKKIAFVFQENRLFSHLRAKENVACVRDKKAANEAVLCDIIKKMRISDFENKYPNELSGGMQKRVCLAMALYYDADIILLDEAFSSLDRELKDEIMASFLKLAEGKTILAVTHDENDVKNPNVFKVINCTGSENF